jgi:hypothetical protein
MNTKDPTNTIGCSTKLTDKGVRQNVDAFGDVATRFVNVQVAQMDAAVRVKLIELGWTPPRDPGTTATNDMPMPEPMGHVWEGGRVLPGYTADQLRAYADARCEKLQESIPECLYQTCKRHEEITTLQAERDALASRVKAMEDDLREVNGCNRPDCPNAGNYDAIDAASGSKP